jgi:hypothetical protein
MSILSPRSLMLGFLSWLVPFAFSFLLIDRTGQPVVPQPLFKSLMVVIGGGVGCYLLVVAFGRIRPNWRTGLALGCSWLAINLAADMLILVPLAKMSIDGYLQDIGLRYLLLPIIAVAIGVVAGRAGSTHT